MRRMLISSVIAVMLTAACGGGIGSPCVNDASCSKSFCNGTFDEGAHCNKATDCPGYADVNYGVQPLGPNKQCINHRCRQVGRCSNDHS